MSTPIALSSPITPSSRARRGILVFAGTGNTDGAGKNQDPAPRSG